jgi:hypothetical protein
MAQHAACKHDQWRGDMTVLVVKHRSIKSTSILTAVIRPMIQFEVEKPRDCLPGSKVDTSQSVSAFDSLCIGLDCVHHLPHGLLKENDPYCLPEEKH